MELALQIISNDKTVRSDTVQDLKKLNAQSLSTRAKKREQLVSVMPAIKKALNFLEDDIKELPTENENSKNQIGSDDENWLEKFQTKLLKQIDDEKRANLFMSRMKNTWKNIKYMVYTSYKKLWESEFDNIVSKKMNYKV